MRTCFWNLPSKNRKLRRVSFVALFALGWIALSAGAQTLARPGWAGSGVAIEPWWRRAVFYRIDPANFQDSDGDGKGDLAGIAQRLGYLQSLDVDAIVLRMPVSSASPEIQSGFESLARAAAERKLRVIVELEPEAFGDPTSASQQPYLNATRFWLSQGAAGIDLDSTALAAGGDEQAAALVRALHDLLHGFPGGRILVATAAPVGDTALAKALAQDAQLIAARPFAVATNAAALRTELDAALGVDSSNDVPAPTRTRSKSRARMREPASANFLWSAYRVELTAASSSAQELALQRAIQRTMAMLLLASRAAVMIDYGEEIGLDRDSLMQWTPKNITLRLPAPIERRAAAAVSDRPIPPKPRPQSNIYGPYVPYVAPAKAKPPEANTPVKIDPDTLPGFTSGTLPGSLNADAETVNVAVEDADPHSLENLYRKLIQLHHGNASLHNGAQTVLDRDDLNALVWVRRPPPGAATATTVVAICNLSSKPLALSLGAELKLRAGTFRGLAGDAKLNGDVISVPAGAVWLGEWTR
jgi:hypothetical protein